MDVVETRNEAEVPNDAERQSKAEFVVPLPPRVDLHTVGRSQGEVDSKVIVADLLRKRMI